MKKRLLAAMMAAVMAMSLLAGCSTPAAKESSDKDTADEGGKKSVTYSVAEEPPTLDPQLANSISSATVDLCIGEGLTRNVEGDIRAAGAEDWTVSDDGLTYTFTLRDGLKWSDGEDLTAEDYVYGMQRTMDPATASDYAFIGMILKNGEAVNLGEKPVEELGVKALDEKTVEITLEYPATYFISMVSMSQFYPARKDVVEKYGQDYAADADKAVYSGPFVVSDWKHGDEVVLTKNDQFWDKDNIKLDEIIVKTVAEQKTSVAMFEQGELDLTLVPSEMTEQYKDTSSFAYTGAVDYLDCNMAEGRPLANKNLRLAINNAINRDEYVKLATNGVWEAATRYVFPEVNGVEGKFGDEYPSETFAVNGDTAKAKEYLDAAMKEIGVSNAADIKIELLTTDMETDKKIAEVLQEQIQKNLGITIEIKQVTYKQRLEMESDGDYDMVFTGWVPDYSDPYSYLELWITDGAYNHSSYSNKEYDKLIEASQTETDAKKRMDSLAAAENILLEDSNVIPLDVRRIQYLLNDKVENFNVYFVGYDYDFVYCDIAE